MHENKPNFVEQLYAAIQLTRPLLRNITARVESDLAGTGITVGQRAIFEVLLAVKEATIPEITDILDLKRQFVGREIKILVENGLINAKENPKHRRSSIYFMSEESRLLIESIRQREMKEIGVFAARFSPEEISAFCTLQKAINDEFSSN